jgi:uncharacterized protein YbjQ (UPF0145 family)
VLVVTTDTVPGFVIGEVRGVVVGTAAIPTNKFDAGMKALTDGDDIDRSRALFGHRIEAMNEMIDRARAANANAIVGMRFDHRAVTGVWVEICCYGTAVVISPQ